MADLHIWPTYTATSCIYIQYMTQDRVNSSCVSKNDSTQHQEEMQRFEFDRPQRDKRNLRSIC